MRALSKLFLAFSKPRCAADADGLIGTWKLVSWQVIAEHEPPQDVFGLHPKGALALTREGRSIALTTAEHHQGGMGDAERAAPHRSMLAYSGEYRVEGDEFITVVDVSWNEEWTGTEQRRHFRLEGNTLRIESAPPEASCSQGRPISVGLCGSESTHRQTHQAPIIIRARVM